MPSTSVSVSRLPYNQLTPEGMAIKMLEASLSSGIPIRSMLPYNSSTALGAAIKQLEAKVNSALTGGGTAGFGTRLAYNQESPEGLALKQLELRVNQLYP